MTSNPATPIRGTGPEGARENTERLLRRMMEEAKEKEKEEERRRAIWEWEKKRRYERWEETNKGKEKTGGEEVEKEGEIEKEGREGGETDGKKRDRSPEAEKSRDNVRGELKAILEEQRKIAEGIKRYKKDEG